MKTKKRFELTGRRIIAILMALLMCFTIIVPAGGGGNGLGWVNAQTEDVGNASSGKLVRFTTITLKDVTTGELIVEKGIPTGNRVNENDNVTIMFEFLIGEMDTIEKDENGNYLTFSTEVNTSGGRLKETGSDYLPDTGNSNRDMGDWSLTSDGKLTVNINDKGADSATEQGNGYVFLKGTGKSIWVTWEGKLDFSGVEDAETGEGMIDVIVAGEKTAVPVNLDDNKVSVSKEIIQKDGNDVYYDKKTGKYFVDYQINVKTNKGYAFIDSIEDKAGTTIGDDFYNLQISLKTAYGSVSKIEGATLADLNTAIRTDEELIITYSREVKPDFLNGSDKYYDSDGSRTNKAIVHGITNHGTKVSPESSPVIYSNASPGIGKEGKYEDGKINWTCYIEIPKDSGISVKTIEDEISHTITPNTATDGNIGAAPSDIKNIANWNKVSDNPIRYEYSYSTDVSELLLEEKNIKAALIKNELNVVFRDQNGEEVTRYIAPVVEVNPGTGESIHTSKATVQKTFEEYNKFKQVSTKYRLLKWEITVTTPSEEDWNDLSYIDLIDDPQTWQHHYLARRVEFEDGTLLYSDSGFNRGQSSNTGYFTDEGKKYFDTSLAEADKTQYPFDINDGCLKLRLKKDNLSPEKDYTFVVYTRVTDDSKLSKRSFKNDVQVLTTFKDTLTVEEDKDSDESGVLKTTEKFGEPVGKGGEVEYTVTFDLGAYAKNLHMQNRTLYPNDKIVFYDEIKNGYLEYVPDSAVLSCDMFQNEYYKIPYLEFTGNLEVSTDGGKTTFTYTMTDELMKLFDYTTGTFTYHGSQFNPILKINYLAKLTDEEARELTLSEEKENNYSNEVKVSYNGVVVGQDTEDVFLTANKVLDKQYVHQGAKLTYTVTVNPDAVKFNDDGSRLYAKDVAGANLRIIKNSIKVSDENGELEIGSGKNQYDYKIEKDQNGDNVLKFDIPDGKALTITYSALIDVAGNIIQPTDRVANTFYLYKHEDVMEIDRVSKSIESGDFVQDSGGSSARATVRLSKVWFNGQKYVSLSDCKFELYECRVKDGIVLIGDRVTFNRDNNIYMANVDGANTEISIAEEGISVKELDFAKLYLLHETEAPNPLNKTDYYFIVSNDSGNDDSLKITDEQFKEKYLNVTDEDGNSIKINKYKDSNAEFEIEDFVEFELEAKKTVVFDNGEAAPIGTYSFNIDEVDVDLANAEVIEGGYTASKQNDAEGNVEFDPIKVTMTSDEEYYYYKVYEDQTSVPEGVTPDDTYYIITMHVKRRDNGEFTHDLAYTKYERDGKDSEYSASYVNADDLKFKNVVESNDKGSLEISKSVYVDGNDRTNTYKDKAYSFTVQDKDKNYYDTDGTKTSDEKIISVYPGEVVTVSGLKPGKYTVKEKTDDLNLANYKYVGLTTNPEDGVVDVVKNEIAKYEAKNDYETKTTSVKIIKTDAADLDARIGGAEFTLTGSTLDTPVVKTTLEATGQLQFDGLLYGATYELAETKAPEGYRVSGSSPWTISVADNGVITITDKDGKESTYTSAGYTIADEKKKSELIVTKTFSGDISDDEKDKVSFQIYAENGDKLADFTYAEMENGSKSFNLNPGKYTVKETTETVDGYTLTRTYTVDSSVNTKDVSKTSYTDAGVAVEIDDKESVTVAFKNDYVKDTGNLKITKKFINIDDNSSIDISKLTDAEKAKVIFEIEGPDSFDEIITLKDFSSDFTYTFENIPVGEYTITEDNQLTDTKEYTFVDYVVSYKDGESEIEPDFNKVKVTKNSTTESTVTNAYEKKMAVLAVSKTFEGTVNETDKNKVAFEIYDAESKLYAAFTYEDMESGIKTFEVLPGEYTVKEVANDIKGITISKSYKVESSDSDHNASGTYTASGVTVTLANKEKAEVAFNNNYVRDSGKLEITKVFANGNETVDISGLTDEEKASVKFTITGPADYETKTISLLDFDSDMKYQETNVPTGNYKVTETGADGLKISGYTFVSSKVGMKDGTAVPDEGAVLAKDETVSFKVVNNYSRKAYIVVSKAVSGDYTNLTDAEKKDIKFTVKDASENEVASFTLYEMVDLKKTIEVEPDKEYFVVESASDLTNYKLTATYERKSDLDSTNNISAVYTIGDKVATNTVHAAETVTVKFTNSYTSKKGSLVIKKNLLLDNEEKKDNTKEFVFNVKNKETGIFYNKVATASEKPQDIKVAAGGTVTIEDLPVGTYEITEVTDKNPEIEGYTYQTTKVGTEEKVVAEVTVKDGLTNDPAEVSFINEYTRDKGYLQIVKSFEDEKGNAIDESSIDKSKISFTITGPDGYEKTVAYSEFTDGKYLLTNINTGNYSIKETVSDGSVENYTISTNLSTMSKKDVAVTSDTTEGAPEVAELKNVYTRDKGKLKIKKSFSFTKIDGSEANPSLTDEIKENIKFTITGPDDYSLVVTYKDFTNGEYEVSGLAAGTYSVKETGYDTEKLIENYSFVTDSSDVALKSDLNVTATNEPVATFKNVYTEDYGYLNISKTVKVDSDSDISNADSNIVDKTFKITVKNADGKYVSAEVDTNNNAVLKDNKNDAVISIKNGEDLTLGRLAAGVYTVEEDKDAALAGDSETAGITLKDLYGLDVTGTGEVTVSKENAASDSPAKTEVVNNYLTRKFVKIIKTDIEGNKLSGAKLEILSSDGTTVIDSWTSDKDKDYFITGLEAGKTYILKETVAPNGYKITTDSTFSFDDEGRVTVNGAASLTTEGKIQTILVKDEATKVSISKVDVTNEKELEGATIQILDENGNVVELNGKKAEWVSTNEPHVIEGLDVEKTYTLRETVAPEGYTIATDTKFELNADGTVNKTKTTTKTNSEGVLLIEDKKTSVKISKVDIANGKEVEGATIQILDKDGKVVKVDGERLEWVSTKTPHEIKGLATGKTYTLKEVIAPEGYTIATETEFVLNADGTINTSETTTAINDDGVLLVEDGKISVKISKVDVVGGAELEGATIQILDKDGNVVIVNGKKLEWVSSNKPYIISGLSSGETYTLRETVAPDGYTVATDTTFVLKADGTVDKERTTTKTDSKGVLLVEDKMTSVKISKVDVTNNEELEGATIQILDENGNVVVANGETLEWVSTKTPKEIKGLAVGKTYTLRETAAPAGYKVATDKKFELNLDGTINTVNTTAYTADGVIFVNDSLTSVKISKKDITNGEELEGATIQILDEEGKVVELNGKKLEWVSTKEAHEIVGLTTNKPYTLRETIAPDGYSVATDTKFELNADGTVNKQKTETIIDSYDNLVINDKKTSVKISKVDVTTKEELEGATIQILDSKGKVVVLDGKKLEWVSTKEAHEIVGLKTETTYTLRETVAPEGYTIAADTKFELNKDGSINSDKTTATTDNGILLVNDDMTSVKVSKVDITNDEELEGARIQILDKDGNVVDEWVSTKEAHEIIGLKTGETYTLRETVAPDGYAIATNTKFELNADGTINKDKTTTVTDSTGRMLVQDKKTSVKISKVDIANGEELEGATIQILDGDGKVVVLDGKKAEWVSTKEPHEVVGLTVGKTYTLRETVAPAGYTVATDTKFELNLDGTVNTVNTTATIDNGVILVEDSMTSVKISKTDIANGEELEGAKIQILDENGKIVTINGEKIEWVSTKKAHEIKGLETKKKYILRETVAPDGYAITTDTYFELNADGTVNQDATTTNTDKGVLLVEDKMTSVKISKVDIAGGEEIEGATIQILDENENIVTINGEKVEWVSTKEAHEIKGLETKKKYILRETIAPDGYSIATDTYFELKADGTVNTDKTTSKITDEESNSLVIEDELTNVYISKRDISGEVILKGAVIQILNADKTVAKDKDGNEIEFTTTGDEFYKISGLTVGKNYYIHEAKAPEGYKLTADVSFYLNKNGQVEFNGSTKKVSGNTVMLLKDAVTELNFTKVGRVNEDCSDNPNETTPLEGVEFTAELLDNDGNVQTGDKAYKAVAVSNDMGTVVFNNLPAGDYIIRETATIDSYKLSDNSYYAHVSDAEDAVFEGLTTDFEGTDKVQNNTVVNNKYKTDIKLQKVSEADPDVKLPGSIYELSKEVEDEEGNKSRVVVASAKTGINGVLILKGVFADVEYTLTEVESPNGYYVSKNPIKVSFKVVPDPEDPSKNEVVFDADSFDSGDGTATIDENGNVTWLEPVTIVRFAKLDEAGNHLSGATLQVVDENGDVVVGPWLSTEEDYEVSGLFDANDDKTYKLVEVSAPKGYEVAAPVEFKVDDKKIGPDENYVITVSMTDKKSNTPGTPHRSDTPESPNDNPGNNPQTGDDSPIIPVAVLMLVSSTGLFIIGKKKRNKRKAN